MERSLLEHLTGICISPLELEFSIFRSLKSSPLVRFINQLQSNCSKQQYTDFVNKLLKDGLLSFFQEYSVLARLIATSVDFWVEATGEFLSRLASDSDKIQLTFQPEQKLGQVVSVQLAMSDFHNRGRAVIVIKFASGFKLVYKPKSLGLEKAYFDFLDWINQQKINLPLKLLKIINCSNYGWMEFAEALPCQDQDAVKHYYQRAGMVLCIVYLLKGNDCHCENLIACGDQPVLVDLETLLHHRTWLSKDDADAKSIANECLQDSVVGTGFLPGWQILPYEQTEILKLDFSGLGGFGEQEMPYRAMKWKHINTDSMVIVREYTKLLPKKNRPFGENIDTSLNNHSKELIDGFRQMYQFLQQRKEELLASDSPITAFSNQKVRLVIRNTTVYASILQNSLNHKCLRTGVEHSIQLDLLSRAFLSSEDKHPLWPLLAAEKQALEQLDIPYFTAYSDSNVIDISSEQTINKFLSSSSYDDVIAHLRQMDDADLAKQISLIRGSLYSCLTNEQLNSLPLENPNLYMDIVAPIERRGMLQQAIAIAQQLEQQAIRGKDNSVTWIGMGYLFEAQRFQLQPVGNSLYDGCCGISLFLAALASVTNRAEFGELSLASLQSLRKTLQDPHIDLQQKLIGQMGIGGATGLASIVYALVRISEFLGEVELIQDAQQLASLMVINEATVNQAPGVMTGVAGTILSLLALYKATKEPATLQQAISWGNYLLDTRVTVDEVYQAWTNAEGKVLLGFSHGAAGIAYALLQLYAATDEPIFASAAREAITLEQRLFSLSSNCQDLDLVSIDNSLLSSTTEWCSGLIGISVARLGTLNILDTDEIRQELDINLHTIHHSSLQVLDNICCGNFSHIEMLLVASKQLSHPELLETANNRATQVLSRANQIGYFQLLPHLPADVYSFGFCQGIAGIGYELLRLSCPDLLPSILLWQ